MILDLYFSLWNTRFTILQNLKSEFRDIILLHHEFQHSIASSFHYESQKNKNWELWFVFSTTVLRGNTIYFSPTNTFSFSFFLSLFFLRGNWLASSSFGHSTTTTHQKFGIPFQKSVTTVFPHSTTENKTISLMKWILTKIIHHLMADNLKFCDFLSIRF